MRGVVRVRGVVRTIRAQEVVRPAGRAGLRRDDGSRGWRARRAWRRLVSACAAGNVAAQEAVRTAELTDPDVLELLAVAPAEPADRAAYLVLIGQGAQHRALDPDGSLPTLAYRTAVPETRERLTRGTSRSSWARCRDDGVQYGRRRPVGAAGHAAAGERFPRAVGSAGLAAAGAQVRRGGSGRAGGSAGHSRRAARDRCAGAAGRGPAGARRRRRLSGPRRAERPVPGTGSGRLTAGAGLSGGGCGGARATAYGHGGRGRRRGDPGGGDR